MIIVVHYYNKPPEVYFDADHKKEKSILDRLTSEKYEVKRSSSIDWFGQDDPKYPIHHYEAISPFAKITNVKIGL